MSKGFPHGGSGGDGGHRGQCGESGHMIRKCPLGGIGGVGETDIIVESNKWAFQYHVTSLSTFATVPSPLSPHCTFPLPSRPKMTFSFPKFNQQQISLKIIILVTKWTNYTYLSICLMIY